MQPPLLHNPCFEELALARQVLPLNNTVMMYGVPPCGPAPFGLSNHDEIWLGI